MTRRAFLALRVISRPGKLDANLADKKVSISCREIEISQNADTGFRWEYFSGFTGPRTIHKCSFYFDPISLQKSCTGAIVFHDTEKSKIFDFFEVS